MNSEKYFLESNGVRFCVGDDAEQTVRKLGKYNKMNKSASCAGIGEDVVYYYNGFRVLAYREGGREEIVGIEMTGDTISTPEGVGLGDGADAVIRTYGSPDVRDGNIIEYESGGVRLRFVLSEGSVRSIKYSLCDE